MNLISGRNRKRIMAHYSNSEMDDRAIARRMRKAAVEMQVQGRTRLQLSGKDFAAFMRESTAAKRMDLRCINGGTAFEYLLQESKRMQTCAVQAHDEIVMDLPACGGMTRIESMIGVLCGEGDLRLTRERLLLGIASFDEVQPLEMAELWAVPEAIRVVMSRSWTKCAKRVTELAGERRLAQTWIEGARVNLMHRGPAFFEQALQILSENENIQKRNELERQLKNMGVSQQQLVQAVHSEEALLCMRMENIAANKCLIDGLKWQDCFAMLSTVDQELEYDPAGIYGQMEEDSKAAVREQVAVLAKRLKLAELTVARHAARAAQLSLQEPSEQRRTVCYWLYEDEGRRELAARMGAADVVLPRIIPDPTGRKSVVMISMLAVLLFALYMMAVRSVWFVLPGISLAWCAGMALVGRLFPIFVKPAKLLKLKIKAVPDSMKTLVTMPVLLSNVDRALEICDQFESLGCLERDENISYLILGDFADAENAEMPGDAEIVATVQRRIKEMNDRSGRQQYFYLHRDRRLLQQDRRWMGRDRKRGALMDLNRLLMGENGAEEAFGAVDADCPKLKAKFRYVVTLDADTKYLPGAVQKLIGAMAHPMNQPRMERGKQRGYAVMQPRMEMTASACVNGFVRLFAGNGGLESYPSSASGFWQDVTGVGLFGGKGIYDVRAFYESLSGALPEGRILSHDLIEGTLAGAAQTSDICFYDGFPASLNSFLKRQNRWMRGDWQLLPLLLSERKYPVRERSLSSAERIRLLDNLFRSMQAPALLGLLLLAVWLGNSEALAVGLLAAYFSPIIGLFSSGKAWKRATAELAMLPAMAMCSVDAIVRTLWRLMVSQRHLLDWTTSADAEKGASGSYSFNAAAAILMLPGFFRPGWAPAALAFGMLFLVGPGWIRDMEHIEAETAISPEEDALLRGLAADTWRFFDSSVDAGTHFLPPDNVQIDPDVGTARRTSPTNIGFYLMSCAAARHLGLIDEAESLRRMKDTMDTLWRMERWKGHFYNWYDLDNANPLNPKYVSAVDSGNFAAALLLCASDVEHMDAQLAESMRGLAREMDFTALYDEERDLFSIGADVQRDRLSESHYDLLASEARILSYTAMMLGQIPLRHWSRLGRPSEGDTLLSWSGTMFEYLMPELFMTAPRNTLLGRTVRNVIRIQREKGRIKNRPWGVSESGYYAFDIHLNYQYRAFGLRGLSLSGQTSEDVAAPYASAMAAALDTEAVAENIRSMEKSGWRGAMGMYEAADYLHPAEGSPKIVKSYMAHHQGMALCGLCNALAQNAMCRAFQRIPEARALDLLLEERPLPRRKKRARRMCDDYRQYPAKREYRWNANPDRRLVDAHLLGAADATALVTADGMIHYGRGGVWASRFNGDFLNRMDGACVHVRAERTGEAEIIGMAACYMPGCAVMKCNLGAVQCEMEICISPEDGSLFKRIMLKNLSDREETVTIADCIPVALDRFEDQTAHAAFRHLFVESERVQNNVLAFRRHSRESDEAWPVLVHMVSTPGSVSCETDREKLIGRSGSTMQPGGISHVLSGTVGAVLDPCSALESTISIAPEETVELHFVICLLSDAEIGNWIERNSPESMAERAVQLATMQAKAIQGFIGVDERQAAQLHRLSALMMDAKLRKKRSMRTEDFSGSQEALWSMGISGDHPLIVVYASDDQRMKAVRDAVRAHEFYRNLGMKSDLVLVDVQGSGYSRPVRDALDEAVARSHLNELREMPGGVHLMDDALLSDAQRRALYAAAVVAVDASQDFYAQVRSALTALEIPCRTVQLMKTGSSRIPPMKVQYGNGFGGFLTDGRYVIDVLKDRPTPAPWANLMANDDFGVLVTERGGGFIWYGNSRSGRLTAFGNDPLSEGWGWLLYLVNEDTGEFTPLLPGTRPEMAFRAIYCAAETVYRFETETLSGEIALCVRSDAPELRIHLTLRSAVGARFRIVGFVDWLMGTHLRDAAFLNTWNQEGACFASGAMKGVGYFAAANARVQTGCDRNSFLGRGTIHHPEGILNCDARSGGWVIYVPVELRKDMPHRSDWVIGAAKEFSQAHARVRGFYAQPDYEPVRSRAMEEWKRKTERLTIETPDGKLNFLANGWLMHQTLTARVRARTGLYQPGGAYGFRDQLQDMLALLPSDPRRVRAHILLCAAHQFEGGDVMHWWHEPFLGVRTRISDDMLFLPYVTAQYVKWTQDCAILDEPAAYLKNVEIESGKSDQFCEMIPGEVTASLHDHCMRAFRRAAVFGSHGLALMGGGDWNDGMNRVGIEGRGESIWLSMFMAACADEYAQFAPVEEDRIWLNDLAERMKSAVERVGWDGNWYLRAYMDDGSPLGSGENEECQIDAISQAWSVLAGLDEERCRLAMNGAWEMLVDERVGILKLLTPPFSMEGVDPGYIRSYPQGVRENGAQYTHAACWLLLAWIRMGDAERAHRALKMLLPINHSDAPEKAQLYRVEPYVMAADVYAGTHPGRGGWTWYTGSAAWMYRCILELLGFEREGNRVRVCALLGDWKEAAVTIQHGGSKYRLVSRMDAKRITLDGKETVDEWIEMIDDGCEHTAIFPARKNEE